MGQGGAKHSRVRRYLVIACLVGLAVGLGQGEDNALSEQGASVPLVGTSVGAGGDTDDPFGRNEVGAMGLSLRSPEDNLSTRVINVRPTPLDNLQAQGRTPIGTATKPNTRATRVEGVDGVRDTTIEENQASISSRPGVADLICAYPWPQGCDYWIGMARCESTLGQDPWAYDDRNPYVGLFQIWIGHNYERGWLEDNANNILAAWELSHEGTYTGAWPYCR